MSTRKYFLSLLMLTVLSSGIVGTLTAQVEGTSTRYIRIGSLQSNYSAYGSERAWNNSYYEGLRWPADYPYTDNFVIDRFFFGAENFIDPSGRTWDAYVIHSTAGYVGNSLYPVEHKQTAKFEHPTVIVDGINVTTQFLQDIDDYDPDQIPDRVLTNVINTSMGVTMTRRILAFSQQYHDNYYIKEYTFTNTGKTDYTDVVKLTGTIYGFRVTMQTRYSVSREGSFSIGGTQSWGQQSWVTKRGENYAEHAGEQITEANPIVDWLRAVFSWSGQHVANTWDNIGGPYRTGDGRLRAPQHAGTVVLHVDKSSTDRSDDPAQPVISGWHAGDTYPSVGDMSPGSAPQMIRAYDFLKGNPFQGLGGNTRMDELYMASNPDPHTVHSDGGGTNTWLAFGPWDLEPGESITIVVAEAVSGLSRSMCEQIGRRWKQAMDNPGDQGPFTLPNGSTTGDANEYKNEWVYTGKDSIMQTFGRAKRNFDVSYNIPQPPLPPPVFDIASGGDRISLSWAPSPSVNDAGFAGYRIYRAIGKPDTVFQVLAEVGPGVTEYQDTSPQRGFAYYYYITAINDGGNNSGGLTNPTGVLESGRFYTTTTEPAYLQRAPGRSLDEIRVVPNPYNIQSRVLQFGTAEPDKIMFYNIPGQCIIRIYTERGDLIETIEHTNGSGDAAWKSVTSSRQVVVSGIYIAHFTVTEDQYDPETNALLYRAGDTAFRKFVIIR
jgi:hypothetical protein